LKTFSRTPARKRQPAAATVLDHALIVGVDRYAPEAGLAPLRGCANDARALHALFSARLGLPAERVQTLIDDAATFAAVLGATEALLEAAGRAARTGEVRPHLWIAFAGYGSRAANAMGELAPSLVLHDSRAPGGSDLLLADLLSVLKGPGLESAALEDAVLEGAAVDVTLLLDCGHRALRDATAPHTRRRMPAVRACPPDLRAAETASRTLPAATNPGSLTVVTAGGAGELVCETPVHDLEGSLWRGALSLAFEESLRACPSLHATQKSPSPEEELRRRVRELGLAQQPHLWGSDAPLRRARQQAAAAAQPLHVDAEEAGLYWVDGGMVHGIGAGCRLQALDGSGHPLAELEVVEVGFERCGCAPLGDGCALELPTPAQVEPLHEEHPALHDPVPFPVPGLRLRSAHLMAAQGSIPLASELAATKRDGSARSRGAESTERVAQRLLATFEEAPLPEGLEAWPDAFTPVLPPDDVGGPVALTVERSTLERCSEDGAPLRLECLLHAPAGRAAPAALVALAWDGQSFWPAGRAHLSPPPPQNAPAPLSRLRRAFALRQVHDTHLEPSDLAPDEHRVTIELTHLPLPPKGATAQSARASQNFGRTLKLYLYAVSAQSEATLGLFQVRFVPSAWVGQASPASFARQVSGGALRYTPALPARRGERVALLLHGFADDSAEEALWALTVLRDAGVAYDRVLTFEYETLHTGIEENARRLQAALRTLGFQPDGGGPPAAAIDLFGHSMGALIGRCLVEQLGGDHLVDRCVFFGSPNEGTPLASAGLLAPWSVALALNVARPALPSLVVAWALGMVAIDVQGPGDLRPGAPLLAALAARTHAVRTRYFLIAGDVTGSMKEPSTYARADAAAGRLLEPLAGGADGLVRLFYGGAHDWAVSVRSALQVSAGRMPGSTIRTCVVPAHHLGFFHSPAVTRQVAEWLAEEEPPQG
jgi:hypothetical protein